MRVGHIVGGTFGPTSHYEEKGAEIAERLKYRLLVEEKGSENKACCGN